MSALGLTGAPERKWHGHDSCDTGAERRRRGIREPCGGRRRSSPCGGVQDPARHRSRRGRDPARFDAWSYRLLVRACYAEGKKTHRWAPNLRLLPTDEPIAADNIDLVAHRDQLERGFRRLSIDHRAVVVLHHYLDMPLDQVAETLGVPAGTVRSRLHHAMRGLRAALEADARPAAREAAQ